MLLIVLPRDLAMMSSLVIKSEQSHSFRQSLVESISLDRGLHLLA